MTRTPQPTHTFEIKAGDTSPSLSTTLLDEGLPVDLSTAASVTLSMKMRQHPKTLVINAAAAAYAPDTSGVVTYVWQAADTAVEGAYSIEWTVTWADGKVSTFPSCGYDTVQVIERLT